MLSAWCAAQVDDMVRLTGQTLREDDLEPRTIALANQGWALSAREYIESVRWLDQFKSRVLSWWIEEGFDLLVTPTSAAPAPRLGWLTDATAGAHRRNQMVQFVRQFNVTGQPAISLPMTWSKEGLPIGVQLIGDCGQDGLLLGVAAQLEEANPWSWRRPSLCP